MSQLKTWRPLLWLMGLCCCLAGPARAAEAPLTAQQAGAYVDLLPQVRQFADRLPPAFDQQLRQQLQPHVGEAFNPHREGLMMLKRQQPAQYRALEAMVRGAGFSNASQWAEVGDRVLFGYASLKAETNYPQLLQLADGLQMMDPQLQALMPPQFQARLTQLQVLARALRSAPASDKAVVRPLLPKLDNYWGAELNRYTP